MFIIILFILNFLLKIEIILKYFENKNNGKDKDDFLFD